MKRANPRMATSRTTVAHRLLLFMILMRLSAAQSAWGSARLAAILGSSLRGRQRYFEARAALGAIAGGDGSAVLGDDAFGYGEAESGAVGVEPRGHEGVEDIREHVSGDAL